MRGEFRFTRAGRCPSAERDRVPPASSQNHASLLSARTADTGLLTKGARMPTKSLPERPSLVQFKLQAKELHRLHAARRLPAAARIRANHPRFARAEPPAILDAPLKLADAQLVIAREYGFESWAMLKHALE